MQVLDEEGDLFGVVNVVDALAVILIIAVLVAGIAVVGVLGVDSEPETRYATIDLEEQPNHIVEEISDGDRMQVDGHDHNLTITDVYATPTDEGTAATVRAQIDGTLVYDDSRDDHVFEFAGDRFRSGQTVEIDTLEYTVEGTVTTVERDGETLPNAELPVVLGATTSSTTADEIDVGDTATVGPHTVATIEDVETYSTGTDERQVVTGVTLATLERGDGHAFGGEPVTTDANVDLSFDSYSLEGAVVRYGTTDRPGEPTSTVAEIVLEDVDQSTADSLEANAADADLDGDLEAIQDVEDEPSGVVLESEDGQIHHHDHPVNRDVTLTVELQTRETEEGLRFHGDSLYIGDTLSLEIGDRVVTGEVTHLD